MLTYILDVSIWLDDNICGQTHYLGRKNFSKNYFEIFFEIFLRNLPETYSKFF